MRSLLNRLAKLEAEASPPDVCLWDSFPIYFYLDDEIPPKGPDCKCPNCRLIAQGKAERRLLGIHVCTPEFKRERPKGEERKPKK